jgi:hypothetical protein
MSPNEWEPPLAYHLTEVAAMLKIFCLKKALKMADNVQNNGRVPF